MSEKKISIYERINQDYIDALQEIGNIGSGHAANALSDLLNRKIDLSLPRFRLLSIQDLSKVKWQDQESGSTCASIITEGRGDLNLNILVIFDQDSFKSIIRLIRPISEIGGIVQLTTLDHSILKEVGSILSLHYLTAINNFLEMSTVPLEPPVLIFESSEVILTSIVTQFALDISHVIIVECDVFTSDMKIFALVILIPEEKTLENLIFHLFGE